MGGCAQGGEVLWGGGDGDGGDVAGGEACCLSGGAVMPSSCFAVFSFPFLSVDGSMMDGGFRPRIRSTTFTYGGEFCWLMALALYLVTDDLRSRILLHMEIFWLGFLSQNFPRGICGFRFFSQPHRMDR